MSTVPNACGLASATSTANVVIFGLVTIKRHRDLRARSARVRFGRAYIRRERHSRFNSAPTSYGTSSISSRARLAP
jgi:hypothetical protein